MVVEALVDTGANALSKLAHTSPQSRHVVLMGGCRVGPYGCFLVSSRVQAVRIQSESLPNQPVFSSILSPVSLSNLFSSSRRLKYRQPGLLPRKVVLRPRFLLLVLGLAAVCAQSQKPGSNPAPSSTVATEQILSSYEGQNVASIEIAGRPDLDTAQFSSYLVQKAGQPFSSDQVHQTAAAIKAGGKFENVRIQVDPDADGVRILMILEPAVYFGVFQFPGAARFPYSRLIQIANYPVQTPFNAAEVERDRQSLLNFFRQEGYFQAQVQAQVNVDAPHALANIVFPAVLGKRAKFGDIHMTGLPAPEEQELEHKLKTFLARVRTVAIRPGKTYSHSTLTRATSYLQTSLQKKGLLGA